MAEKKKSYLTLYIFAAIVAAVALALLAPELATKFQVGGEVFLRLLKMMVVPLVMASVMSGILGMGDIRRLGRPGGYTLLYYLTTTILAVILGQVLVNAIKPGVGAFDEQTLARKTAEGQAKVREVEEQGTETTGDDEPIGIGTILRNLVLMLFTDNLIKAGGEMQLLPLIVFSIIFAGMLTTMGPRVDNITTMIVEINDALLSFVMLLMYVAPLGIFCLVAARFGEVHAKGELLQELSQTSWYITTVLSGLAIHAFVTLPLILWFFTRRNPYVFMYHMSQAILTAFSTASSSATLPVNIECTTDRAGVSKRSTEFVLPLGATVNMDGTALYEAAAVIFIAQATGMQLGMLQQLTIAITATLAAIGAAGIPQAGLFTMIIVLGAVHMPAEYIGLILSVDWFLDRFRTAVNVFGDSVGAAVVEKCFQ